MPPPVPPERPVGQALDMSSCPVPFVRTITLPGPAFAGMVQQIPVPLELRFVTWMMGLPVVPVVPSGVNQTWFPEPVKPEPWTVMLLPEIPTLVIFGLLVARTP